MFYRRFARSRPASSIARVKAGSTNIVHAEVAARGPHWLGLIVGAMWDRRDDRLFAGIGNPAPGAPEPRAGALPGRHLPGRGAVVHAGRRPADADAAHRRRGARVRRRRRARRPVGGGGVRRLARDVRGPRPAEPVHRSRAGAGVQRRSPTALPAGPPRAGPAASGARQQRRRARPRGERHAWGRRRSQPPRAPELRRGRADRRHRSRAAAQVRGRRGRAARAARRSRSTR